jgi:hypothetical protein
VVLLFYFFTCLAFIVTAIMPYSNSMLLVTDESSLTWLRSTVIYVFVFWVVFTGLVLETLIWAISLIMYMIRRVLSPASVASDFAEAKVIPKLQNVLFGISLWKTHVVWVTV